jgi:hypothetical protein
LPFIGRSLVEFDDVDRTAVRSDATGDLEILGVDPIVDGRGRLVEVEVDVKYLRAGLFTVVTGDATRLDVDFSNRHTD